MRNKLLWLYYQHYTLEMLKGLLIDDPKLLSVDQQLANEYASTINCNFLTYFDQRYPPQLLALENAPLIIFYKGNIRLLSSPLIAITGSTNPSNYGLLVTSGIVRKMQGKVILTNFGYGIEQHTLTSCLVNKKYSIGILASGFDNIYPINNFELYTQMIKNNLIISTFLPTEKITEDNLIKRNQLMAALCEKVIVIEANLKAHAMHIADYVIELNKEVYAVPGSIYSERSQGTNLLIQEGANVMYDETIN